MAVSLIRYLNKNYYYFKNNYFKGFYVEGFYVEGPF